MHIDQLNSKPSVRMTKFTHDNIGFYPHAPLTKVANDNIGLYSQAPEWCQVTRHQLWYQAQGRGMGRHHLNDFEDF